VTSDLATCSELITDISSIGSFSGIINGVCIILLLSGDGLDAIIDIELFSTISVVKSGVMLNYGFNCNV
jgi:hypothetical protein